MYQLCFYLLRLSCDTVGFIHLPELFRFSSVIIILNIDGNYLDPCFSCLTHCRMNIFDAILTANPSAPVDQVVKLALKNL